MREADFIVVGQGIAGSCLALELADRGARVEIVDDGWESAACLVAAGVINPITGKRLVKSWRSSVAHPRAREFYRSLEARLGKRFFHDRKILQLCRSPEEAELWRGRAEDPEYAEFISDPVPPGSFGGLNDSFGARFIGRSAWVEPPAVMSAFREYFLSRGMLRTEKFDFSKLDARARSYAGRAFRGIIFCEGWRAVENPYFSWLPYRPAKGEILELKSPEPLPEHIIHRGKWIMKTGGETFRMGSTWDRERLDCLPTEGAGAELMGALPGIFGRAVSAEVAGRGAGVRPCTATTRPHLGAHPACGALMSFNGFGSKGFALSPYFARHFADWIFGKTALDPEADLSRHIRKFWRPPAAGAA